MPETPSFPNRQLFILGGLGAGLALGVGIVQLLEARDKSIRTRQDVETYLGVQTLAVISHTGSARKIRNLGNARRRPEFTLTASSWKERNV
jgi:capsular polysaccharide biosynthesis protein